MIQKFEKINSLKGELYLAGDKSISHRAVMFASMAEGKSIIRNCSESEDVISTMNCFAKLGCKYKRDGNTIEVIGKGIGKLTPPQTQLDAGNSGTTTRLISGILAAQNFESEIIGDASLSKRPMKRIVEPLKLMGANLEANKYGTLPLKIFPSKDIQSISYTFQVASAQVKSAMILLAIHLDEVSEFIETVPTRNHTELMLGLKREKANSGTKIFASKKNYPKPFDITVPADISSAAFFIVAALLSYDSEIILSNVSLNPTRTGLISVLKEMGGQIEILNRRDEAGEEAGDIRIVSSQLKNVSIPKEIIPNVIDEIPILSAAGLFAEGNFRIENAKELRVKESDRIKSLCENYKKVGVNVIELEDGFELRGTPSNIQAVFESYDDHRIAMTFGVLSSLLDSGGYVSGFECVGISNPKFYEQLTTLVYNSKI
ncbi:MAG: 3-phosphoshikimate 1-carboxyvinyltransferase [Ignavibacteria bacterium]|nr:MAG: 3-phosphoshikimate 1-carboxyvinyltransferase [Ignavibacteria bacterium]KAF0161350.1 MAG: 3-phosphoshikimate 1-carboxyvinyltransferase [Ignavibacteria bacterium]